MNFITIRSAAAVGKKSYFTLFAFNDQSSRSFLLPFFLLALSSVPIQLLSSQANHFREVILFSHTVKHNFLLILFLILTFAFRV